MSSFGKPTTYHELVFSLYFLFVSFYISVSWPKSNLSVRVILYRTIKALTL